MTTELSRPLYLSVESFARAGGLHPELVLQLHRLGLLDAAFEADGRPFFAAGQLARVARIRRLRESMSINYAALGLVMDLLDRIETLEAALRSRPEAYEGANRPWIRTA